MQQLTLWQRIQNCFWSILAYFTRERWDYLITGGEYSCGRGRAGFSWEAFFCRLRRHPPGMVWHCHGLEPDTHCAGCGDDIG